MMPNDMSALAPVGPAARRLYDLGWPVMVYFVATCVVMWLIVLWVAVRKTGTLETHDVPEARGGEKFIYIGGFLIPAVSFAVIFFATIRTMSSFPMHDHETHEHAAIRVIGHQWWWEVQYPEHQFSTANELHIPVGRPVDVELESVDVIHSLWAPRIHGKVDLIPGMKNFIRLQANDAGVYSGGCAEFCGLQHALMRFTVVAEEPAKYDAWVLAQKAHAPEPSFAQAARGKELFMRGPCVVCHTVRGTDAKATVGPDLTHLASRQLIAAYMPQDIANLHAWIINAPSLKPGTRMPALTQFSGDELHDLVAYLQTLK